MENSLKRSIILPKSLDTARVPEMAFGTLSPATYLRKTHCNAPTPPCVRKERIAKFEGENRTFGEKNLLGMDGNFLMNPISDYPVWGVCQNRLLRKRAVARIPVLYVWGVRQNGFLRKNGEGKLGAPPMNLCLRYTDWVI